MKPQPLAASLQAEYRARDRQLRRLRFATGELGYDSYLRSERWQQGALLRLQSGRPRRCFVCWSTEKLQAHHATYERLAFERLEDLVWLCDLHHKKTHTEADTYGAPLGYAHLAARIHYLQPRFVAYMDDIVARVRGAIAAGQFGELQGEVPEGPPLLGLDYEDGTGDTLRISLRTDARETVWVRARFDDGFEHTPTALYADSVDPPPPPRRRRPPDHDQRT